MAAYPVEEKNTSNGFFAYVVFSFILYGVIAVFTYGLGQKSNSQSDEPGPQQPKVVATASYGSIFEVEIEGEKYLYTDHGCIAPKIKVPTK